MDIGLTLKEKRQELKLSIEEISANLLINIKFIEALENNKFSDMPTEVMLLGFLTNYSNYLGLNSNELISEYKKTYTRDIQSQITDVRLKDIPLPNRQMFKINLKHIFVIFLVIVVFFGIYEIVSFVMHPKTEEVKITETVIKKNVLEIKTTEDVWVRVIDGENPVFEGILSPNTIKTFESPEQFRIRIGNMLGISVTLNGNPVELPKSKLVGEIKLP
ncbi:MAG: hypothetical protein A2539_00110 [Elusimicrobia bacterium RIFOXYD2_FULL_34_15]|nr:MAG: hypothetical protein A2539_00110 [Elusimicrobia bacterium RIFOXYD2_FULL_34_15]